MNRIRAIILLFALASLGLGSGRAEPVVVYEQTPLPAGFSIRKVPNFAQWQMTYNYDLGKSPDGGGAAATSGGEVAPVDSHLPKSITVTQTKPVWHVVLLDMGGNKKETWSDGMTRFEIIGAKATDILPISSDIPGNAMAAKSYFGTRADFPEMDWVTQKTYLGVEKGVGQWVFKDKDKNGAMVWIDPVTSFPVRWKKGNETRTFQFLSPPSGILALPPNVARLSEGIKKLDALSRSAPPHL